MNGHFINILIFCLQILEFWNKKIKILRGLNRFLVGHVGRHGPMARAGMTRLTGLVPCLGLATSPSGGHGTTQDLFVPDHNLFKKAWARPSSGRAGTAWISGLLVIAYDIQLRISCTRWKVKEMSFPMKLILCTNLSKINRSYQKERCSFLHTLAHHKFRNGSFDSLQNPVGKKNSNLSLTGQAHRTAPSLMPTCPAAPCASKPHHPVVT
jgi:hypothetical protein